MTLSSDHNKLACGCVISFDVNTFSILPCPAHEKGYAGIKAEDLQ